MGSLREAPATVPALGAIVLFVVWATSQAGYPLTHWAPGALIVLVLLAIVLLAVPLRFATIPLAVKLALACLAAYTALSFLSILWASAPGGRGPEIPLFASSALLLNSRTSCTLSMRIRTREYLHGGVTHASAEPTR